MQTYMSVHTAVLYAVFIVSALAQGYLCTAANSTAKVPGLVPPAQAVPLRRSADLAESLRRQLMRDNYDYQTANTDDERNRNRQPDKQKSRSSYQHNTAGKMHNQLGNYVVPADTSERWHADPKHTVESHNKPSHNTRQQATDIDYANDERNAEDNNFAHEMRDAIGPDFAPYKRGQDDTSTQDKPEVYDPTYSKRRDAYDPQYKLDKPDARHAKRPVQVAPVSYPARVARVEEHSEDSQDIGDAIDTADALTADDSQGGQNASGKQYPDKQYSDSDEGKQANDKPTGSIEKKTSQETDDGYEMQDTPEPNLYTSRTNQEANTKEEPDTGHAIAKKDLLYYMDDEHMRRNNDVSADLSSHSAAAEHAARGFGNRTTHRAAYRRVPDAIISLSDSDSANVEQDTTASHTTIGKRNGRSTASTDNVTYKLLTMRSRGGRRGGSRRLLQERAAGGAVALLSLDRAPLPQFRLPRSRRQYMHERRDNRPPLAVPTHRHHHHIKH